MLTYNSSVTAAMMDWTTMLYVLKDIFYDRYAMPIVTLRGNARVH
jgi:hypothetical protein